MLYLVAIFFPWLSLFLVGKPFQAIFSIILSVVAVVLTIFLGLGVLLHVALVIHACIVISGARADQRTNKIVEALEKQKAS